MPSALNNGSGEHLVGDFDRGRWVTFGQQVGPIATEGLATNLGHLFLQPPSLPLTEMSAKDVERRDPT